MMDFREMNQEFFWVKFVGVLEIDVKLWVNEQKNEGEKK